MPSLPTRVVLHTHKDRTVLALDTGHSADSLEGLRLVKASRGSGWLWRDGAWSPWETKGVLQLDGHLVLWGESPTDLGGLGPGGWLTQPSQEAWRQLLSCVAAWTTREAGPGTTERFQPGGVIPVADGDGWAWLFPHSDLAGVLSSVLSPEQRREWSALLHPDATAASWAFTTVALQWRLLEGALPWDQDDETFLRQEIRDLGRSLGAQELPQGLDADTQTLWLEALAARTPGRGSAATEPTSRWTSWAQTHPALPAVQPRAHTLSRSRQKSRQSRQFWRLKGTLVAVVAAVVLVVVGIAGSIVWGIVKPDPSDTWSPREVVQGYYAALDSLQATEFKKLVRDDQKRSPDLARDEDLATNLFVLVQVRFGYEHVSPLVPATTWVAQGRPPLTSGQVLFGLTDLVISPVAEPEQWTADYDRWSQTAPTPGAQAPAGQGEHIHDVLTLAKTWKGWKIVALSRTIRALP